MTTTCTLTQKHRHSFSLYLGDTRKVKVGQRVLRLS